MSAHDYEEQVREKQLQLEKTRLKNIVTKEAFFYSGQGCFTRSGNHRDQTKYIKIYVGEDQMREFYAEPYSIAGTYDHDYYIKYFDGKPYVSLTLLQTLYLFDESKWRKVLAPVEYTEGLGYNFLEFLQLSLPERHPDDQWLKDRSSGTCNRLYFKDLTTEEILRVPD